MNKTKLNKIKRAHGCDDVNAQRVYSMNKKNKPNNVASNSMRSNNYFSPLQTVDEDDQSDEVLLRKPTKVHIAPITILKVKMEEVHALCKSAKIDNYSIRKISIGIKLFCQSKPDFEKMCNHLTDKYEFFTYATKSEKPYKALLFGLDKQDPQTVKNHLNNMGLKCLDVKLVLKKGVRNLEYVIFVVYFQRQTITMKELRHNYSIIEYVKVKWEFQKSNKSQITQCYNCQLFGHGSSRCRVKTFCANCAGPHKTAECKETDVKCANCSGPHPSYSDLCPSKQTYLNIKQRT